MPRTSNNLIHYERKGVGHPIVLIHGVGGNLSNWDEVCDKLSIEFDIIRLDLRGHGESGPIDKLSIDTFVEDVVDLMNEEDIRQAHLVGFSLGGLIAQRLAITNPDRFDRIILLSAVAGRTPEERERVLARLDLIREGGIKTITAAAKERWFTEVFARKNSDVIERRIAELEAVDVEQYLKAYQIFGETELVDTLHKIRHPTLIMTGELDPNSNVRMSRTMNSLIPNSKLKILPALKHSVLVEASSLVANEIRTFVLNND